MTSASAINPRALKIRYKLAYRNYILAEDLEHFLNAKHAAEAFEMLDDDQDGQASLKDVRAAVCTIFKYSDLSLQRLPRNCPYINCPDSEVPLQSECSD